jgi:hypothetical protein
MTLFAISVRRPRLLTSGDLSKECIVLVAPAATSIGHRHLPLQRTGQLTRPVYNPPHILVGRLLPAAPNAPTWLASTNQDANSDIFLSLSKNVNYRH